MFFVVIHMAHRLTHGDLRFPDVAFNVYDNPILKLRLPYMGSSCKNISKLPFIKFTSIYIQIPPNLTQLWCSLCSSVNQYRMYYLSSYTDASFQQLKLFIKTEKIPR